MRWRDQARNWGTDASERARGYPCDALLPAANEAWFRAVTVEAEPARVFRWLCQLRAAPYSYDWIDNLGRRSPRELTPGLDALELGQRFMTIFSLVGFERDAHVTLRPAPSRLFPPLVVSYCTVPAEAGTTRLLVKLALELRPGLRDAFVRVVGPWLDGIMMRRQLLDLKALAEAPPGP